MSRRTTAAFDTIDVIDRCAATYCRGAEDPEGCERQCRIALNVVNQSFAFSPALSACHSRIEDCSGVDTEVQEGFSPPRERR